MKKFNLLIILMALLFSGCSEDIWLDHNDPRIYIPKYGFSINKAWLVESNEYTIELSAYCAGVRTENRNNDITVNYNLNSNLITQYNNDITQPYSGKIVELPKDCYTLTNDKIVIEAGKTHGELGIKVDLQKVKALGVKPNEVKYAIPLELSSCSEYNLQEKAQMLGAIYCVTIEEPSFYFWDNRDEEKSPKVIGSKIIYGDKAKTIEYRVTSYGLVLGEEYTLNLDVDPSSVPLGGTLMPDNSYEIPKSIVISKDKMDTYVPVKIISEPLLFQKIYYLPVGIVSASKYGKHAVKGTLLLRIEVKNDYEWNYKSLLSVTCDVTQRTGSYSVNKSPISISKDIIRLQLATNNTIAGIVGTTGTSSTAFNNKFYQLKIIPTDNKNKHKLEIIKESTTPATFEFDPDKESYYDWDYEKFYLYYRFQDSSGKWVNVSEILEAQ